ncbi:MAG: glycogen synthase GlgA [Burkholderiales bacterium]
MKNRNSPGLRILFVTSELAPLVKTGGLADVSAALPAALRHLGVDAKVLVPAYPPLLSGLDALRVLVPTNSVPGFPPLRLWSGNLATGVPVIAVDCPDLYAREGGPYQDSVGQDWPDNALRFALLGKIGALLSSAAGSLAWRPHLVHCNDWPAGLTPAYLHFSAGGKAASLMTVHNQAYQGIFPASTLGLLNLPPSCLSTDGIEYYGNISFLKAGIAYASHITTVSPTYAVEIQTEALGFGMQGLLVHRRDALTGILNGIDTEIWNPATDLHIARNYSSSSLQDKAENKRALQERLGLRLEQDVFVLGVVSRFNYQKGLDLLLPAATELMQLPVQLALLGSGEQEQINRLAPLARAFPGRISLTTGYNEPLAHQIEAGADAFLMPSRYEPCGLNQMYSQRYGTPPIVHATGGLIDTVTDCNPTTRSEGRATGFAFQHHVPAELLSAIKRAHSLFQDPVQWRALQLNGMAKDFSWDTSAKQYCGVYEQILKQDTGIGRAN